MESQSIRTNKQNIMDKNLGKKAKDMITGFSGIIIGKIEYLTGCNQYGITPPINKEGATGDTQWFDINRVKVLGKGFKPAEVSSAADPGGFNRDCPGKQ